MDQETRRLPGEWHIHYEYSIGRSAAAFLDALAESRLLGVRCHGCSRVFVPPKDFCEFCFSKIDDLVEVGNEGTIEAATVVTAPFAGSPEVPYVVAYVRLDGASVGIANFVHGVEMDELDLDRSNLPESVAIGRRVRAHFSQQPAGRLTDFWFEPVSD